MSTDPVVPLLFKSAEKFDAKIAFHIEPYPGTHNIINMGYSTHILWAAGRNEQTVKEDLKYLVDKYGASNSFYRDTDRGNRPVIYLYDSYHTKPEAWAKILDPQSADTIRGTKYDTIVLGLYLNSQDKEVSKRAHFDGVYTYFAAEVRKNFCKKQ
jgi:glycoprotein endo-alpha-1,2-mannosidase